MKKAENFNRRLPLTGAVAAVVVALPTLVWGNDFGAFLGTMVLVAVSVLLLLLVAIVSLRRQALAAGAMLCIFVGLGFCLFKITDRSRTAVGWFLHSRSYKAEVLKQPVSSDGSLKHVEWDGWGLAGGGDTTVYLVNDPTDQLRKSVSQKPPLKLNGVPCAAVKVQRLEDHWYTVLYYTDTYWDHCD